MRPARRAAAGLFFLTLAIGCASGQPTATTPDAGAPTSVGDEAGSAADADVPRADAADGAVVAARGDAATACVVKRAASASACADDCGARLTLPGGDHYCTTECATAEDCRGYGVDLVCPETIGACVPRCTGDSACKAGGFARCDPSTNGCDTL